MHLLTYGTLMVPEIMKEVSGCTLQGVCAIVEGYQRYGVRDEQYPGIVGVANGRVEGVLYLDVPPEAVVRLDLFEGMMYSREPVKVVRKIDGGAVEAMVYVVKPEFAHLLTSEEWDFHNFLAHGKQLFKDLYSGFAEIQAR